MKSISLTCIILFVLTLNSFTQSAFAPIEMEKLGKVDRMVKTTGSAAFESVHPWMSSDKTLNINYLMSAAASAYYVKDDSKNSKFNTIKGPKNSLGNGRAGYMSVVNLGDSAYFIYNHGSRQYGDEKRLLTAHAYNHQTDELNETGTVIHQYEAKLTGEKGSLFNFYQPLVDRSCALMVECNFDLLKVKKMRLTSFNERLKKSTEFIIETEQSFIVIDAKITDTANYAILAATSKHSFSFQEQEYYIYTVCQGKLITNKLSSETYILGFPKLYLTKNRLVVGSTASYNTKYNYLFHFKMDMETGKTLFNEIIELKEINKMTLNFENEKHPYVAMLRKILLTENGYCVYIFDSWATKNESNKTRNLYCIGIGNENSVDWIKEIQKYNHIAAAPMGFFVGGGYGFITNDMEIATKDLQGNNITYYENRHQSFDVIENENVLYFFFEESNKNDMTASKEIAWADDTGIPVVAMLKTNGVLEKHVLCIPTKYGNRQFFPLITKISANTWHVCMEDETDNWYHYLMRIK